MERDDADCRGEPFGEDGPDEDGFKGPRPWNGFQEKPFGPATSENVAAATMVIVRPEEYAQFEAFKRGEREAARAIKDAMQECEYWRFKYEKAAKGARYKFAWDTTQFQPCSHPDISYCDESCVKAIHDSIEKGWCAQKC